MLLPLQENLRLLCVHTAYRALYYLQWAKSVTNRKPSGKKGKKDRLGSSQIPHLCCQLIIIRRPADTFSQISQISNQIRIYRSRETSTPKSSRQIHLRTQRRSRRH